MALGDLISAAVPDIADEFEAALRSVDSVLLKDDVARAQVLAHARIIVTKTVQQISGGPDSELQSLLPREIGVSRAEAGIHPEESLQAANLLFGVVMRHLSDQSRHVVTPSELATVAMTLHGVITNNVRMAADSYIGVLLNRIHQAQVEERKRISRELHDRIGTSIGVAQRDLELVEVYWEDQPERAHARIAAAKRALVESMGSVRQTIDDLRVVEPMDSLEKAVKHYLEESAHPDIASHVEVNGDQAWAPAETVEEVFLIIREALRNVINHAGARHIVVRVDISPSELRASIADDGRGFEPDDQSRGTGLLSMRERAALLNGSIMLRSVPGSGTLAEVRIPLVGAAA